MQTPDDVYYNTYMNLLNIKEDIISKIYPDYYDKNYIKFSKEVDARYSSDLFTLCHFKTLGFIDENKFAKTQESMSYELILLEDETRTLNGNIVTIDEIFETLNLNSNVLARFLILKFQYKDINGKLVKKTKMIYEMIILNMKMLN